MDPPYDTPPTPIAVGGTIPYAWYRTDVAAKPEAVVTQVGTNEVAWLQDQTGSRHLAAVGNPQLTENGIDGRSVITFEGQDDYMIGSEALWGEAAPGTVFAVWRRTGAPAAYSAFVYDSSSENRQFFSINSGYSEDKIEAGGAIWDGDKWEGHFTSGGVLDDVVGTDQWAISTVSHVTGLTDTIRINGEEVYMGNLLSGGMTGLRLGGFILAQQKHWTGDIAEFVVFEGELTPEEVETIELILMVRWGIITMAPGDTNNDGLVDAQDAAMLADHWGASVTGGAPEGDFNGDEKVDIRDAAILAANWNPGPGEGSVPEPTGLALVLTALATWTGRRRR
jgi:hypothetical protein